MSAISPTRQNSLPQIVNTPNDRAKINTRIEALKVKIEQYTEDLEKIKDLKIDDEAKQRLMEIKQQMIAALQAEMTMLMSEALKETSSPQMPSIEEVTNADEDSQNNLISKESTVVNISEKGKSLYEQEQASPLKTMTEIQEEQKEKVLGNDSSDSTKETDKINENDKPLKTLTEVQKEQEEKEGINSNNLTDELAGKDIIAEMQKPISEIV